ncbi:MAG: hypothetical protein HGN29_11440 [Asgard group archaeon]|nr:hypothetical protein [Asgard group archaeon]
MAILAFLLSAHHKLNGVKKINKKLRNAVILVAMVSILGFSTALVKGDTLYVDVEITIKQIVFDHNRNDGDIIGPGEIGFKVTAYGGENYFDYYGTLGKGTHTISGVSFFFERYLPYAYFTIETWDKDGSDYEKDLVFRAKLEVGNSGPYSYDYNGVWCYATWFIPYPSGWYPVTNDNQYSLLDFNVIDMDDVEHSEVTHYIPKMTIDVDLTYYYAGPG